jgi:5'-methylthioadenosine phosphorylase
MVTDYDCWREGEAVEAAQILSVMRDNVEKARAALVALARSLPEERAPSPIDRALDGAIMSPRSEWDRQVTGRLDAIAGRYLRELSDD